MKSDTPIRSLCKRSSFRAFRVFGSRNREISVSVNGALQSDVSIQRTVDLHRCKQNFVRCIPPPAYFHLDIFSCASETESMRIQHIGAECDLAVRRLAATAGTTITLLKREKVIPHDILIVIHRIVVNNFWDTGNLAAAGRWRHSNISLFVSRFVIDYN